MMFFGAGRGSLFFPRGGASIPVMYHRLTGSVLRILFSSSECAAKGGTASGTCASSLPTFPLSHFYFHTFAITLSLSHFNFQLKRVRCQRWHCKQYMCLHTFTLSNFHFHNFPSHFHFHFLTFTLSAQASVLPKVALQAVHVPPHLEFAVSSGCHHHHHHHYPLHFNPLFL